MPSMAQLSFYHLILMGWLVCNTAAHDRSDFLEITGLHVDYHEIVYPKINEKGTIRVRRDNGNELPRAVAMKDWVLETSVNDRLIISPNFVAQWIHSDKTSRDLDGKMPQDCQIRHGSVKGEESFVAVTLCEDDVYGLVHLRNESFFIHPLTDGRHILYKSTNSAKDDGLGKDDDLPLKHLVTKPDVEGSTINYIKKDDVSSLETKDKSGGSEEEKPNANKDQVFGQRNFLTTSTSEGITAGESREKLYLKRMFEKSLTKDGANDEEDVAVEKITNGNDGVTNSSTDFDSIMNIRFDDLLFVSDNVLDVYLKEKANMLSRLRDYLDDIWMYDDLNKSRENGIFDRASGYGDGPKIEYASDGNLNVKLAEGSRSFGGVEEEKEAILGSRKRVKRNLMFCNTREFHNLTGDTFDLKGDAIVMDRRLTEEEEEEVVVEESKESDSENRNFPFEEDSEHIGYFVDRAWRRDKLPKRKPLSKEAPPRWLELAIAADHSVVDFHGPRIQQYILALLNIVSAIYKDPSLESNMKLVIVRMIFYAEKKDGMVREGNARRSLENVNRWNRGLLTYSGESHDVAVWLTRLDIGGPSGYAPVSGACDPARSCALNRDEGLTSAFIIAHEVAHVLGLTHDGDENAANTCGDENTMGSIMAPMVAATFHRFHWSTCSRREFHQRAKQWSCLLNQPKNGNATHLKATIQETFTMDEQCRMEFGEGYGLCKSFDLQEPCSHLWCGHENSSQVCKTKKGPPLEGTACGEDRWCVNGYCEPVDRKRFGLGPVVQNTRDGGWSSWGSWGKCSRSCGVGVQFRSRKCNKPTPAYGGIDCKGKSEEFKICELSRCLTRVDLRSQQCNRLASLVGSPKKSTMTWLAYEPDQESMKCQLACRSKQTGEVFFSEENLIDGTPCSYGSTDVCVQGKCRAMGCDNQLNSKKTEDTCGECDGDNSNCNHITNRFQRKLRRVMSRIAVIPRSAYNVRIDVTLAQVPASYRNNVTVTIRDRRKRRNDVGGFDSRGRAQILIVEGAAFRPQKLGNTYTMWARGPLFSEIVVSFAMPEEAIKLGVSVSAFSRYTIHRNDQNATDRYSWLPGGWGPCSSSCGGGTRQKTVACKDELTGRIVQRRKCPLSLKPVQETERCNLLSCDFKWVPGPWEPCTTTCGDKGIQHRRLYCVHTSLNVTEVMKTNAVMVYRDMVPPDRCEHPPRSERECNRIPCRGRWVFSDWSSCSQTCGRGVQSQTTRCLAPKGESLFECESVMPVKRRPCRGLERTNPNCAGLCKRDMSEYCSLQVLERYCEVPGFKKRCCRSCQKNSLTN